MDTSFAVFSPQEGAVQINGLQAIAEVPNMFLGALMDGMVPQDNVILHGFILPETAAGDLQGPNVQTTIHRIGIS